MESEVPSQVIESQESDEQPQEVPTQTVIPPAPEPYEVRHVLQGIANKQWRYIQFVPRPDGLGFYKKVVTRPTYIEWMKKKNPDYVPETQGFMVKGSKEAMEYMEKVVRGYCTQG